ncbi:MAG: DUF3391 domain-containing protein, partial [Nitrospirales bacterium]|nr:DUF3391 domain-containing protein [Nitrospirales bacterium]
MGIKRIPIDSVSVGMYLCGIDQSWLNTPFLLHRFLIKRQNEIDKLKKCGILAIDIDTDRGIDVPDTDASEASEKIQADGATPPLLIRTEEERINHLSKELRGVSLSQELSSIRQTRVQLLDGVHDLLETL